MSFDVVPRQCARRRLSLATRHPRPAHLSTPSVAPRPCRPARLFRPQRFRWRPLAAGAAESSDVARLSLHACSRPRPTVQGYPPPRQHAHLPRFPTALLALFRFEAQPPRAMCLLRMPVAPALVAEALDRPRRQLGVPAVCWQQVAASQGAGAAELAPAARLQRAASLRAQRRQPRPGERRACVVWSEARRHPAALERTERAHLTDHVYRQTHSSTNRRLSCR